MKLSLRKTTLVAAVMMSLCVLRTMFRSVIYDLLLAGHPIRASLFGDMVWCVAVIAIALFFWGMWKYRDEMPQLEKKSMIALIGSTVVFLVLYTIGHNTYSPTFYYFQLGYRLDCTIALWYFYHLLKTTSDVKEHVDSYNSHYYALMIASVLCVAVIAVVVSNALWYFVSADYFMDWHMGAWSISVWAFIPLLFWIGSLVMPWLETVEMGKETDKMVFTKKQQLISKISVVNLIVLTLCHWCLNLGWFGFWGYYRYELGGGFLFLYFTLFICWLHSVICFLKKETQDSWLKRFNRKSLRGLGVLVSLTCVLFAVGQYIDYETKLFDNNIIEFIYGLIFAIACISTFVIIFAGWLCNTFIVFLSLEDGFVIDNNRFRRIKRIFCWGMVVLMVVGGLNVCFKYIKDKVQQENREQEGYRLKSGDLQYSDSIVINTLWEAKVYNINTKKYLHEAEIDDILPFDMVAESKIVYIDSAYNRGYLNVVTGEIDIKAEYDYAWLFSEGVAAVVKDNKIGFIDKNNTVVIPFQYPMYASYAPYTYRFYNGYCKMTDEKGRCGLIDHEGKWVIEPKYQRIKKPVFGKYRKVKLDGKWGLLDENLRLIVPTKYDHITVVDSMAQRFEVTYNGKMYEVDRSGKLLNQLGYAYMHPFYEPQGRYGSYERTSGRYMQVWVRQEYEVDYNGEDYSFSLKYNLENCGLEFRTGIIDVVENKVVVPVKYCEIEFDNLPKEIDENRSLVFKCIGPYSRLHSCRENEEWITLEGKRVSVKYE
ncbi:MAG: WG repeat-containing protein [Paludibacteraceae bacterium]|nr:WG repeat-containing protein [Paludibacteraceae bacterium]